IRLYDEKRCVRIRNHPSHHFLVQRGRSCLAHFSGFPGHEERGPLEIHRGGCPLAHLSSDRPRSPRSFRRRFPGRAPEDDRRGRRRRPRETLSRARQTVLMRLILDTNILVSALLSPLGAPAKLLDAWERKTFTLVACDALEPMRPGSLTRQYKDPENEKGANYQLS